jgi:YidC/Oxa1 family membrane protein insertase
LIRTLAAVPWSGAWQALLGGIGWLVAKIYEFIPNYGVTIIVLTVLIRVVLLPLGIKQIRSMHAMQVVQPKIKQIQTKYKGNKQKQQEEIMKMYKEHGVNPFSGCWPVLLQFPILISMYSVLRYPQHPPHLPAGTKLYANIEGQIAANKTPVGTNFLGTNLLCSSLQAGKGTVTVSDSRASASDPQAVHLDCGTGIPIRIPYFVFAILMFGTTWYQQRQMQKASPPGATSQQQQALTKFMPLMFGVFGFLFPAGLVIYWTVSNGWQIGQQHFMLKSRPSAEDLAAKAPKKPAKKGFMSSMMQRAEEERKRREGGTGTAKPSAKPGSPKPKPKPGGSSSSKKPGSSGGGSAGNRKKRPKR